MLYRIQRPGSTDDGLSKSILHHSVCDIPSVADMKKESIVSGSRVGRLSESEREHAFSMGIMRMDGRNVFSTYQQSHQVIAALRLYSRSLPAEQLHYNIFPQQDANHAALNIMSSMTSFRPYGLGPLVHSPVAYTAHAAKAAALEPGDEVGTSPQKRTWNIVSVSGYQRLRMDQTNLFCMGPIEGEYIADCGPYCPEIGPEIVVSGDFDLKSGLKRW